MQSPDMGSGHWPPPPTILPAALPLADDVAADHDINTDINDDIFPPPHVDTFGTPGRDAFPTNPSDIRSFFAAPNRSQPLDPFFPAVAASPASSHHALPDTVFRASSGFLSSDDSDDDDDDDNDPLLFADRRPKRRPKAIVGSKTSFILGDKLGEGAYAIVKEGIDERSLRIVAVKILDMRRLRRVRGGMEGIEREVSVQKRLKRHPNLIELIDVIRHRPPKTKMHIILEMATGCSVHELAEAAPNKRLCESQVANFTHQALLGMHYMHGKGVVHRDIKPSNMMLMANGVLKISDFGVAEFLDEYNSEDNVSRTSGSPAFQAPEIARGEHDYSGMKVDVWALGISIYMLLMGRIPFQGETLVALFECIGSGQYEPMEGVSDEVNDVVGNMLTVAWKERAGVDELLKHPWVVRGGTDVSNAKREELGWFNVPKKEFGILDVVRRMYVGDEDVAASTQASERAAEDSAARERELSASRGCRLA